MEAIKQYLYPVMQVKKEYMAIFLSLFIFLNFPWLSRHWDITSAPIDPGALSAVIMAIFSLLLFKTITWWLIKALWPVLANYSRNQFESDFKSLPVCYKVIIFLSFYLLLLYSFVFTLVALV